MPSPTVAVVGGGQLARMMQQAAIGLQIRLIALVESPESATAQVVPDSRVGAAADPGALAAVAGAADVLTFEHEHVPGEVLRELREAGHAVEPGPEALRYAQDKIAMRERLTALGVPCPRWRAAGTPQEVTAFGEEVGWPIIAKTRSGGYDGKGVAVLARGQAVPFPMSTAHPVLLEERVPFTRELAALTARRPSGQVLAWPVVQTIQADGVCSEVISPAPGLDPATAAAAQQIATAIADGLGVTGVLAVELFETDGELVVNELAMRPHNSGHVTIDAHRTSQFEQHLRAVLDLPLGETGQREPWAVMVNLLGSQLPDPTAAYPAVMAEVPGVKVHLYGKDVRPHRKLGHVTALGTDLGILREQARRAIDLLSGKAKS